MSYIQFHGARKTIVFTSAIALTVGCGRNTDHVVVERAAVTRDVIDAPAAAYFTVIDKGTGADSVVAVHADVAQSVSLQTAQPHRMPNSSGYTAMLMVPVASVPLGRNGSVRFVPGGNTAMLMNLHRPLAVGDSVQLTITLASGRSATTTAPVVVFEALEQVLAPNGAPASESSAPSLAEGTTLYRTNGCASCHGSSGFGDGPVGRTLTPAPRDFRDSLAFKAGRDATQIARMLAMGIPGGGNMPLYTHLTNHERAALALYVTSLRTASQLRSNTP